MGIAACGSSKKSSGTTSSSSSTPAGSSSKTATTPASGSGTIPRAGSTVAAPVYGQWASALSGLTGNYQAVGSRARVTALEGKGVDFGASGPPPEPQEGKEVPWPTGTGAKGNAGVAGAVKQTEGAVGYVEQAYALQNKFTYASVKNKEGHYVLPTLQSTTAAGQDVKIPANLGVKIKNPGGAGSYPITSQTFIIVNKDLCKAGTPGGEEAAKNVVKFISYGLGEGQKILSQADYAALPAPLLAKSKEAVKSLQCNGSPIGGVRADVASTGRLENSPWRRRPP